MRERGERPLLLQAVYVPSSRLADGPIWADSGTGLSAGARLLWVTLRDRSVRRPALVSPEFLLDCDQAEGLAAVHELVAGGWLAIRWATPMLALAMVLEWPREMLDLEREWAEAEREASE